MSQPRIGLTPQGGFESLPLELRQAIYRMKPSNSSRNPSAFFRTETYNIALTGDLEETIVDISLVECSNGMFKLSGFEGIRPLVLANRTISNEVLDYCFGKLNFCLRDDARSCRYIIREFYRQIGAANQSIVHHITIPYFTVDRIFEHHLHRNRLIGAQYSYLKQHYDHVFQDLRAGMSVLSQFPSLSTLDLVIDIVECFPRRIKESTWLDSEDCIAMSRGGDAWHSKSRNGPLMKALRVAAGLSHRVCLGMYWRTDGLYWNWNEQDRIGALCKYELSAAEIQELTTKFRLFLQNQLVRPIRDKGLLSRSSMYEQGGEQA